MTDDGPETRYAWSGEFRVAYQVLGDGPLDLVISPGCDLSYREARGTALLAHYLRRPSPYARTLVFERGTGIGRVRGPAKESMDDVRAVMDVAGQRGRVVGRVDRIGGHHLDAGERRSRGGDLVRRQRVPRHIRRSSVLRRSAMHAVVSASCPRLRRISP